MEENKYGIRSFSKNFWTVIFMEFTERGSYYGVMAIFAIYLSLESATGGLGLTKPQVGLIQSIIVPLIYFIPIFAGMLADRYGYRLMLTFAFILMSAGYFFSSMANSFYGILMSMTIVAIGAGTFKPIVSGTIALETNKQNSTLGFGIFYWSVNLGSFFFPLILVPYLKALSYSYVFLMAAIGTGALLLVNIFFFREPKRVVDKTLSPGQVLMNTFRVLKDWKFILLIVLYSGFWVLYYQMFGTVLWYLRDYVNTAPINHAVNSFLSLFVANPDWKFDVEHVTVVNALTIILLQIFISNIVKNTKALPTMITGILIGTAGMALLAFSSSVWIFIAGIFIFSIGEMTAQPKFISYVGLIAPPDKKAQYMGFSFLNSVIGSGVGGILGSYMYVRYIDQLQQPKTLWLLFSLIGVATAAGIILFNRFAMRKSTI